jgi:acetyl esterase/lipase
MPGEEILETPPPSCDARVPYGPQPFHFGDLFLPRGVAQRTVVLNIHGGFWRNRYDLDHAGHLCSALANRGLPTWNVEYRRVGDEGGGWPGTFEDIRTAYRFLPELTTRFKLDLEKVIAVGHSAGGQLALCLAAYEPSVGAVVSLAGVVDLQRAWELHLGSAAVADLMGGPPDSFREKYFQADPMHLNIPRATQRLIHGKEDGIVPPDFSRTYWERKKERGEEVEFIELEKADHFAVIDPHSPAWPQVEREILNLAD